MKMTYPEYIQNPMGKQNAVISNREMYRQMYTTKFDKIMVREVGKMTYHCMKGTQGKYYILFKIPSEVVPDFYYDVLVEFTAPKGELLKTTLKNYYVKFYSNDPSFVYTFAHAFIENEMFIPEMKTKMSKEAVHKVAKVKNPTNQVGYVKSLYFAYIIIERKGLFNKVLYVDKYDEKQVKKIIMDADQKIALRQEAAKKIAIEERKEKHRQESMRRQEKLNTPEPPKKIVKSIKHTATTKMSKTTKKTMIKKKK